jgi:hypothetical protein
MPALVLLGLFGRAGIWGWRRRMAIVVLTAQLGRRRQVRHEILYMYELASIRGVGSARHLLNLFLNSFYTVTWIRVVREKLSRSGISPVYTNNGPPGSAKALMFSSEID